MKKIMLIVCMFILLSMVACSSRPHTFEIQGAAKITVTNGNTGKSIGITDADSIMYVTDNISGLTYSKGDKVNSDGRYYKGMEADYEIDLAFLEKLFEE